ncbi:hypothetical protein GCK72_004833 [Caenorhabditis remanei]|uniref:Sushi domain-containing protein n=1 Tax=Caenorhabditis remanei TaxID=31234 RepID=A0A6A5HF81_CAERE|nr:hypothetical protein GCK72_004833 [Caenorhabditis remanei]KAF1764882.1 hypothetical protein GCK72_004833 [Caenorhabditis remanei]
MKTLFLILFLPILAYFQSDEVLDCGYLKDIFVYNDFANVNRNYVGGCCTSTCLDRLEEHYPGWRTPTEINPASWYVSMLYSLKCCKDTPSIAVITETSSKTSTVTLSTTTATTITIPTTISTTTINTTVGGVLDCGWLGESFSYNNMPYDGRCCTQTSLDNMKEIGGPNWKNITYLQRRLSAVNWLMRLRLCIASMILLWILVCLSPINSQFTPSIDCGWLRDSFQFINSDEVNQSYNGKCCTSEALDLVAGSNYTLSGISGKDRGKYINYLIRNEKCADFTTTTIPPTTTTTENLNCSWLDKPFIYTFFLTTMYYDGKCCNQNAIEELDSNRREDEWRLTTDLSDKYLYVKFLRGKSLCSETTTAPSTTPTTVVPLATSEFTSTGALECGILADTPCCKKKIIDCLTEQFDGWLDNTDDREKYLIMCGCVLTTTSTTIKTVSSNSSSSSTSAQTITSSKWTTSSGQTTDSTTTSSDGETSETPSTASSTSTSTTTVATKATENGVNNEESTTMTTTATGTTSESRTTTDVESSSETTGTKLSSEGTKGTGSTGTETTALTPTVETTTSATSTTISSTTTSSTPTSAIETTGTLSPVTTSEGSSISSTSTKSSTPTTSHTSFSSSSTDITETTRTTQASSTTPVTGSTTTSTPPTTESTSSASTISGQTTQSTTTTEVTGTTTSHTTSAGTSGASMTSGTTGTTRTTTGNQTSTSTSATGSTPGTTTNTDGVYFRNTTSEIFPNCTRVTVELIYYINGTGLRNVTYDHSISGCSSTTPMTTPEQTTTYNWPTGGTTRILPTGEIILSESLIAYPNCTTVLKQLIFNPSTNETRTETTTDEYGCRTSTTPLMTSTTPMTTPVTTPTKSTTAKTTTYNWPTGGTTKILPSGEIILSESLISYPNCTTVLMQLIFNASTNATRTETTTDEYGCRSSSSTVSSSKFSTTPMTTTKSGTTKTTATATSKTGTTASASLKTTTYNWPTGGTTRTLPSGEIILSENLIAYTNCTTILMQLIFNPSTNQTRTETTSDAEGCKSTSSSANITTPMSGGSTTTSPSDATTTFQWPTGGTTRMLPSGEMIISESLIAYKNCTTILMQLIFNPSTKTTRTETTADANGCKSTSTGTVSGSPGVTSPMTTPTTTETPYTFPDSKTTQILPNGEIILSESLIAYPNCTTVLKQLIFNPATNTTRTKSSSDAQGCKATSTTKPSATTRIAIASSTPIPPTTTTKSSSTIPVASSTSSPVTTTTPPPTTTTSPRRTTTSVPVTCPFPSNLNLINTNRPTPEEIKESYAFGERIIHICKKYYIQELSKQPLRIYQCGEDGKWIGTLQKCVLEPGRTEL